jgi:hypothetical protein
MLRRPKGEAGHNDFMGPSRIRAYECLKRAVWLARRALVAAKLYRLRSDPICHAGAIEDYATPTADVVRWPQVPLILGDKWDL